MTNPTRTRRRFTAQQKAEAVELCLQEGLSCNAVAERLGLPSSSLVRWVRQARIDRGQAGPRDQGLLTSEEGAELSRLRKEVRELRNAFAHSAESAFLADQSHSSRLVAVYAEARANPLWAPLEAVLNAQPLSAQGPLDPALRDYILLITILVAFLEATAQQLTRIQPSVVMGFSSISRTNGTVSASGRAASPEGSPPGLQY